MTEGRRMCAILGSKPRVRTRALLKLVLAGMALLATEAEATGTVNANFTVSVTVLSRPPCEFNGGSNVLVDFGNEVLITRVDGVNYTQPIPYNLTCLPAPPTNALKLQFRGAAAGFDSALTTSNPNLGIRLMNGSAPLAPGAWLNFTWPNTPAINAVLVKRPGTTLTPGEFTGAATLLVDYQ